MRIQFSLKDLMYPCFAQKTMNIQSKLKDAMNIQLQNNQTQFCHIIELK